MTRKTLFVATVAIVAIAGMVSSSSAGFGDFEGVKVGGGFLWNDEALSSTGGGIHASVDFGINGRFSLSPFYEYSRKSGITSTLAGGEIHYNLAMGDRSEFYLGPGFGVADAAGSTKFHVNGVAGVKYGLTERFGFFVQAKYAWAADELVNGVTAHGGIVFPLMGR